MLKNTRNHLNHERADRNDIDYFYIVAEDENGKRVKSPFALTIPKAKEKLEEELTKLVVE